MPKSSSRIFTPSALSSRSEAAGTLESSISAVSVTSIARSPALTPVSASTCLTISGSSGCASWRALTLTLTGSGARSPKRARQRRRLLAGLAQGPRADLQDQGALLGDRDELARREQPALGVLPAHERLDRVQRAAVERHDRLVVEPQLSGVERAAERPLGRDALERSVAKRLVEDLPVPRAALLRAVHRDVRVAQQALRVAICAAREHDADARGHDVLACPRGGTARSSACWTRSATRTAPSSEARSSQSTTNSSPPKRASVNSSSPKRATVSLARRAACSRSATDSQELVAGAVPERVVDVLEPVEIEEQQRGERAVALGARQRQLEAIAEEEPVRQAGQGVVRRLVRDLLLRADALDDAPELPADLGHHLEQGGVGRDRRRGEELQHRGHLAVRVDRERERSADAEVLSWRSPDRR